MGNRTDAAARAERTKVRLIRFLAAGEAEIRPAARAGSFLIEAGSRGAIAVGREPLASMLQDGTVELAGTTLCLSAAGRAKLKRVDAPLDPFIAQQAELAETVIEMDGVLASALVNLAESPLAQLARLKAKDGGPFLGEAECRAGERLRADYTRGQIMPRMSANWQAAVASGRRSGGVAELTDAALAARQRVDRAIEAVGPELAGVLIDVCCFLKGLETVEREHCWPVRSAKIVLKAALGALARHYDPPAPAPGGKGILHWGARDYRPSIGG